MFAPVLFALLSIPFSAALSTHDYVLKRSAHDHDHSSTSLLPKRWFHDDDHSVHSLFKRQGGATDGVTYAQVGSPAWASGFPTGVPDSSKMPQAWKDALAAAVASGKIPNIPIPSDVNDNPIYPKGTDPLSPEICSAYYKCRAAGDMWDAPAGKIGIGFDDGPYLGSGQLYDFLAANNQKATHFMIGINILNNAQLFLRAFNDMQGDIAAHTWTHRHMSTLSNEDLVAEFGWSMEIIHNSTGGRLPRYWRPPYGDMDNRVRAIAREIFAMETILWNQDTEDWSLTSGGTTMKEINSSMTKWITGPKSPGLIILEHELSAQSSQAFQDAYPLMKSQGWQLESVAQFNGTSIYLNSEDNVSAVDKVDDVLAGDLPAGDSSSTPPTSGSSSTGAPGSSTPSGTHTSSSTGSSQSGSGGSAESNGVANFASPAGTVILTGALLFAILA